MSKEKDIDRVFDENIELKDNAMLKKRPELFYEWNFEKNDELGLDIYKITFGSDKKAWWTCPDCESSYDMPVSARAGKSNRKCPYCSGRRVNHTNSLASLRPDIAKEWHPTKNGDLTPHDVTLHRSVKVWWLGGCNHEWKTRVGHRVNMKSHCPYCSNPPQKILAGFNDMWTTNPELASQLLNPEDGYRYAQNSNKKADWKCADCGSVSSRKNIASVNVNGLRCAVCSDKTSLGERIVFALLIYLKIDFCHELSFDWSKGKRYDFYLKEFNTIIEVHGQQHYTKSFENLGGDSVEEVQKNDKFKERLAKENRIENYIVLDASRTSYAWIMNSIIQSELLSIIDVESTKLKDFNFDSKDSRIKQFWRLWNSGLTNKKELEKFLKITDVTFYRYLNLGRKTGVIKN